MAYCTLDDLKEQIPETSLIDLSDDDGDGAIDESVTTRAISDADAEIDGYCQNRYTLPFDPVPVLIRKISVDVALYNLYTRPGRVVPEERKDRYTRAIAMLNDIAKDIIDLGVSESGSAIEYDDDPIITKTRDDRIFTMGRVSDGSSGTLDNF